MATVYDGLAELPAFNPDEDREPLPGAVVALRAAIAAADAVIFCTPEYAGTLPGSCKNLLDWTVGGSEMYGKTVSWMNVAPPGRGNGVDATLATVLGYIGARDCGIYNVVTVPHARRRGLGTALTALHLHEARDRGCTTASLQATEMSERLYAAVGFQDLGRFIDASSDVRLLWHARWMGTTRCRLTWVGEAGQLTSGGRGGRRRAICRRRACQAGQSATGAIPVSLSAHPSSR